jgi:hypothetical protein
MQDMEGDTAAEKVEQEKKNQPKTSWTRNIAHKLYPGRTATKHRAYNYMG